MMDNHGDLFALGATRTPEQDQGQAHKLRAPCKFCGCEDGFIRTRGGQDVVRCAACRKALYNAPKTETGRKARTVQTTHENIKPSLRAKIILRANGACEACHRSDSELHVGHWVSVDDGHKQGLPDEVINSEENLLALCPECNLGIGNETIPVRLVVAAVMARVKNAKAENQ